MTMLLNRRRLPWSSFQLAAALTIFAGSWAGACDCGGKEEIRAFGGSSSLGGSLTSETFRPPIESEPIALSSAWVIRTILEGGSGAGQPDGADGVAAADVDLDGIEDLATGHEQGLRTTVKFNPGPALVRLPWPKVTLPTVNSCSPEDAQVEDLDADGAPDVIAGCETGTSTIEIYFAPAPPNTRSELLVAANWTRVQITAATQRSMRIVPIDIVGDSALELVVGGKESSCGTPPIGEAQVGYYSSATPRNGASWTFTPWVPVGWTQQLYVLDFDADTDLDVVYSDYERVDCPAIDNSRRGGRWLELDATAALVDEHPITAVEGNHRWFTLYDADEDDDLDYLDCHSDAGPPPVSTLQWLLNGGGGLSWTSDALPSMGNVGACIHPIVFDPDLDGRHDIAVSYSHAQGRSGAIWMRRLAGASLVGASWARGEISGSLDADSDVKFDNLVVGDPDGDGDPDLYTSEQHIPAGTGPGLGVVYLDNPRIPFVPPEPPAAIVCTALDSGSGTAATSAVTNSLSPAPNAVIYAVFQSSLAANPAAPTTVTGNGLTWAQEETIAWHNDGDRRMTVFRAMGAAPSSGAITASWGAVSQTSFLWSVIQCTGVDAGGTSGSAATVQSVTTTVTGATTLTNTLAALAAPTSVHLAFVGLNINNATAPDADFAELTDVAVGTGAAGLEAEWATNQTAVTPTFATANAGAISLEVRIAP
jgi:hypothetical protein